MARVQYHRPTTQWRGFWRTENPALGNIIELFEKAQPADNGNFLVYVHGTPCQPYPEQELEEDGYYTRSYSLDQDTIFYAIEDGEIEVNTLFPGLGLGSTENWNQLQQLYAVAIVNLAIASDDETCWKFVKWIQCVDTQTPQPTPEPTLTKKQLRDLARRKRRLQS